MLFIGEFFQLSGVLLGGLSIGGELGYDYRMQNLLKPFQL